MKKYHYQTIRSKARLRSELMQTRSRAEVKRKDDRLSSIADSLQGLQLEVLRPGTGLQDMMAEQVTILNGHTAILETPSKLLERLTPDDESKSGLANQLQGKVPLLNAAGTDFADPELKEQLRGLPGPQGERGLQGLQGVQGLKGDTGAAGKDGADGKTWKPSVAADGTLSWSIATGEPASANIRGPQGLKGDKGERGLQGLQGVQGLKGDTGAAGKAGADGKTWKPSVASDGTLSWSTATGEPASANIRGPQGEMGVSLRNLLLDSDVVISNSIYNIANYYTSEDIIQNKKYTFVARATTSNGQQLAIWTNNGSNGESKLGFLPANMNDEVAFVHVTVAAAISASYKRKISIYNYPRTGASSSPATIKWMAMYEGHITPPSNWHSAPEDIDKAVKAATNLVNGKNAVFRATPVPPYKSGDLWVTLTGEIKVSHVTRTSGSYTASDWYSDLKYDNTKTVIDDGLVTSGTLQAGGNSGNIRAGMTGKAVASNPNSTTAANNDTAVRFWAGNSFASREKAPFRVLDNGECYATRFYGSEAFFSITAANASQYLDSGAINLSLTGNRVILNFNPEESGIGVSLPNDIKYLGSEVEIINPTGKPLRLCNSMPDINYCNIDNYLSAPSNLTDMVKSRYYTTDYRWKMCKSTCIVPPAGSESPIYMRFKMVMIPLGSPGFSTTATGDYLTNPSYYTTHKDVYYYKGIWILVKKIGTQTI